MKEGGREWGGESVRGNVKENRQGRVSKRDRERRKCVREELEGERERERKRGERNS